LGPPDAIFELEMHKNAIAAGALFNWGSLQCSPDFVAGLMEGCILCGSGGEVEHIFAKVNNSWRNGT